MEGYLNPFFLPTGGRPPVAIQRLGGISQTDPADLGMIGGARKDEAALPRRRRAPSESTLRLIHQGVPFRLVKCPTTFEPD